MPPSPIPIPITGLGVIAPNALNAPDFTAALRAARSGIRRIAEFDTTPLKIKSAATVINFNPLDHLPVQDQRRTPRMIPFALAAAREALQSANLPFAPSITPPSTPSSALSTQHAPHPRVASPFANGCGITLGTGGGGLHFVEDQYRRYFTNSGGYSPFTIPAGTHGNLSSELSIQLGLHGASHVVSTGCASSTDALGYAMMHIRTGTHPLMLSGGADAPIAEGILKGFELMRILAKEMDEPEKMSRPFSLDRDGFVLGEGAWMFVLESPDHARARSAPILAELLGWGSTCDAFHRVQPSPDPAESIRAIQIALAQAGLTPDDIDYVNLHGTATQLNDPLETMAMHAVFGPRARAIPMSATKSLIGHPQGASGAAGLAATILSLRHGFLHPTANLTTPDPLCDLDYIPLTARVLPRKLHYHALCNCIAFGSKNSALVVRVYPPA